MKSVQRVAIATMIGQNQGNRLQNYALQTIIERNAKVRVETLRVSYGPSRIKKFIKSHLYKLFRAKRWARFEEFDSNYIRYSKCRIDDPDLCKADYSLFVIGSDQVWNPTFEYTGVAEYLPQIPTQKKISYAASFGVSKISENRGRVAQMLSDISYLSVRERAGQEIVAELTRKKAELVLDPTMLIESNDWIKLARKPSILIPKEGYILKYVLGENIDDASARTVSGNNDLAIIDLKNKSLPVGPAEFIWLIAHASYVCTDSFHASVFSILLHVPFSIFERVSNDADMSSRFDTLCEQFGLESRRISNSGEMCPGPVNWDKVDEALATARHESLHYLEVCLHVSGLA